MTDQETKQAAQTLLGKLEEKIKNFINKIRIPSLLSFFISKNGKINPTVEEALKEAPPAKENWIRMGLGKKVFGLPVWLIILIPIAMKGVEIGGGALQRLIGIGIDTILVAPLLLIGYFIYRNFKK